MKAKAALLHEKGADFKIEAVELSAPKDDEVLVRIAASGICHTDAVVQDQLVPVPLPAVLGHEGSGIVEKIGANVKSVAPGDHVVLSFATCGACEHCLNGDIAYCTEFFPLNFFSQTSPIRLNGIHVSSFFGQSSFATYAIAHERSVVKVDRDIDLDLLGPLGCGIQTGSGTVLNKLKPEFGSSIAIYGCGSVGLSAVMAAKIAGCAEIIAVDVFQQRLDLALELGATHALNAKKVDVVEEVRKITNGGTNYAIEATGIAEVFRQSVQGLRTLGTACVVGVGGDVTLNMNEDILSQGKTVTGVIEGSAVPQLFIPKLIEYYKKGRFPFDKLVSFYEFDDINQAFEDSKNGVAVKPVIRMKSSLLIKEEKS
ncbi:NAD(P)-dependent alcohol dehydrogenase [Ferviditalea candida]|uniref:NAD(P)-dependent alcohol dehydrogenase n=1 Tax=Ferviditalea candida TaxID=3108399 RepID=A0ABU5ZDC1_9BACL|nr:NAD(P)-dependent alcohol dehydrogenase [Paenibacillaceae bacterium T2]